MDPARALPASVITVTPEMSVAAVDEAVGRRANVWRRWADELSMIRAVGGFVLGAYIGASEYPVESYDVLVAGGAMAFSDWVDGRFADRATAIDGKRSRLGAWVDQMTDKIFVASLVGGVAVGSFLNNRAEQGLVTSAALGVFVARDIYVTRLRRQAEDSGANVNTAAQWHGKAKTATQMAALMALISPAMENEAAHWGALGLLWTSAGVALYSAWKYRKSFKQASADE